MVHVISPQNLSQENWTISDYEFNKKSIPNMTNNMIETILNQSKPHDILILILFIQLAFQLKGFQTDISWANVIGSLKLQFKVGCVFPMVIWSEFRMGQYRDDDHREDTPHFNWREIVIPPASIWKLICHQNVPSATRVSARRFFGHNIPWDRVRSLVFLQLM